MSHFKVLTVHVQTSLSSTSPILERCWHKLCMFALLFSPHTVNLVYKYKQCPPLMNTLDGSRAENRFPLEDQ